MDKNSLLERVMFEPNTGCWLWFGKTNFCGYGELHPKNNEYGLLFAHRLSYIYHKGDFDRSLQVLHTCDMPCCINPDHLFLGTHQENMKDMDRKGRRVNVRGTKNPKSVITEAQSIEIRNLKGTGLFQREIAKMYGISRSVVSCIFNDRTWRHTR